MKYLITGTVMSNLLKVIIYV